MGSSISFEKKVGKKWMEVFKAMKFLKSEVKQLHRIFERIGNAKRTGTIDIVEWLTFLDLERTYFTEHIFSVFDKDGTGKIDFYEFVISLWKFCILGDGSISKYPDNN